MILTRCIKLWKISSLFRKKNQEVLELRYKQVYFTVLSWQKILSLAQWTSMDLFMSPLQLGLIKHQTETTREINFIQKSRRKYHGGFALPRSCGFSRLPAHIPVLEAVDYKRLESLQNQLDWEILVFFLLLSVKITYFECLTNNDFSLRTVTG